MPGLVLPSSGNIGASGEPARGKNAQIGQPATGSRSGWPFSTVAERQDGVLAYDTNRPTTFWITLPGAGGYLIANCGVYLLKSIR